MSAKGDAAKQVRLSDENHALLVELQKDTPDLSITQLANMALSRGIPVLKMGLRALKKATKA